MSRSEHFKFLATMVSVAVFLSAESACAASGSGEPSIAELKFYWLNFALYLGLLFFILRKPIRNGWASRVARIRQTVTRSADEVSAAERELNAVEALSRSLATEQERVKSEIANQAELEGKDIVRQARERAERIVNQAHEMLKGESRSAESQFRATLVARATEIAKQSYAKGEQAGREASYLEAAMNRAKSLVQ
jgi:F0F1-type ATP synthase membrane subunit b/b'